MKPGHTIFWREKRKEDGVQIFVEAIVSIGVAFKGATGKKIEMSSIMEMDAMGYFDVYDPQEEGMKNHEWRYMKSNSKDKE